MISVARNAFAQLNCEYKNPVASVSKVLLHAVHYFYQQISKICGYFILHYEQIEFYFS